MNKPTTFLLLILLIVSCQKNIERIDIADELRGNTFNMISINEKDTLTIEFKDTTYTMFEYSNQNLPWRIAIFDNSNFLVLDSRIIGIKQKDKNSFDGLFIGEKDYEILIEKRETEWNKELLNGIWIEEKHYAYFSKDSITTPLPPPPPPASDELTEEDFQWPPFYEIKNDTISTTYYYQIFKTHIDLSNSGEFIIMNLRSNDKVEKLWKIKELNDSIMIINRTIEKENKKYSSLTTTEENIKLIKKR